MVSRTPLRCVSLFSGCGGSDLGAKRAGADIIFANDNYPPAARSYKKHKATLATNDTIFEDSDVAEIDKFPSCDLLMGCYPCQSFTMGGPRTPEKDARSELYKHFLRCLEQTQPSYFIAENVAGLRWLAKGKHFDKQLSEFSGIGRGYSIVAKILDAKDYGVPADRKRIFIVGVRQDLGLHYSFPIPTHGPCSPEKTAYKSHGVAIEHLPENPIGEYYHHEKEPFSWWFMSRNRKRRWIEPGYTVVSNWRHITLHPGSPTMKLVESRLSDGFKQTWAFTDEYDNEAGNARQFSLDQPRRLSWRECAILQSYEAPDYDLEPDGTVAEKFWQIGNMVPPLLMEQIVRQITTGEGLRSETSTDCFAPLSRE